MRARRPTRSKECAPEVLPGDIISTGTPTGIEPLAAGDQVEVEVEGIGMLRNPVVDR